MILVLTVSFAMLITSILLLNVWLLHKLIMKIYKIGCFTNMERHHCARFAPHHEDIEITPIQFTHLTSLFFFFFCLHPAFCDVAPCNENSSCVHAFLSPNLSIISTYCLHPQQTSYAHFLPFRDYFLKSALQFGCTLAILCHCTVFY